MPKILKKEELKNILPHRDAALCLDRAGIFAGKEVRCIFDVKQGDQKLDGHFPEKPINPGHWLIEGMALSGALLIKLTNSNIEGLPLFREVSAKFYGKILPPARIFLAPKLVKNRANKIFTFEILATQNGKRVATATIKGVVE